MFPTVFGTTFTTILEFDKTTHQWFRNAQNANSSCEFGAGSGVGSYSSSPADHGEGWLYYATTTNLSSGCYIPVWDFDVSEIPDNAIINDVDFIVDIVQHQSNDGNFACDFREVNANISKSFDSSLWNKITTDLNAEIYVSADTICTGTAIAHNYDLGKNADMNLQDDLNNDEKFTISVIKTGHTRTVSSSGEGSYNIRLENAQLVVEYEIINSSIIENSDNEDIFSIILNGLRSIWYYLEIIF
tara:strand:+ start:204 stop:935 length:732 start_codon:yes stop_codon:yes gene_type:complete